MSTGCESLRLEEPLWLLALFLIPVVWYLSLRRKESYVRYSSLHVLKAAGNASRWRYFKALLRTAALVSIVLALARPQFGTVEKRLQREGRDLFLCIDASGSMGALDFDDKERKAARFHVLKEKMAEFIRSRAGDRIGMIVFAREAFTVSPLTLAHGSLLRYLEALDIGFAGEMTALGPAILLCAKRLRESDSKSKVILLVSDGCQNSGSVLPLKAALAARALGIKIHVIGVGGAGGAPFRAMTPLGEEIVYRQIGMDEETLRRVARATGGEYFNARDARGLSAICRSIDRMERTVFRTTEHARDYDLHPWFIAFGLAFLCLTEGLANTRFRGIP